MKALVYHGPRDVRVKNVPDAKIERPTDVLVRVTSTNICASDLHMYEGRTDMEAGRVLGHETPGQIAEVGNAVDRIKAGDWVCLPFNVACGFCKNCERGLTGACLFANPGTAGAAYGFAGMGSYSGGQAEYQCHDPAGHEVPNATMNDLVKSVRATGGIGVVGDFIPEDPGAADALAKEGKLAFDFGQFWFKGQRMATGQANVKAYNRYLCELIHTGRARPSWIVSHELALDEAPEAYRHFDTRDDGWTKVILHPAGAAISAKRSATAKKTTRPQALPAH